MTELSLFDALAPVRRSDPPTSREAANKVARPSDSQALVLAAFRQYGAMTDEELEGYTQAMTPSRRRTARSELSKGNDRRMAEIVGELTTVNPGWPPSKYESAARHQLRIEGFRGPLWDSGVRRPTRTGRDAVVWCEAK